MNIRRFIYFVPKALQIIPSAFYMHLLMASLLMDVDGNKKSASTDKCKQWNETKKVVG